MFGAAVRGWLACCQDTLETSLCALRLFPTAEGPDNRQATPELLIRANLCREDFRIHRGT